MASDQDRKADSYEVLTAYRCEHGEPLATRRRSGTWVFHDRCVRCSFAPMPSVRAICGMVAPNQGPDGEPLACAWKPDHLPEKPHSWAWVPTQHYDGTAPSP